MSCIPETVFRRLLIMAMPVKKLKVVVRILPAVFLGNDVVNLRNIFRFEVQTAFNARSALPFKQHFVP